MTRTTQQLYDVIVIGGGASGMMAAGRAAERGKRVLLLEKNAVMGEKLKITGGGRCNITNAQPDEQVLLKQFGKAAPFLFSPFSQFGVKETFTFFESRGLPLVVESNNRAFPATHSALDVFNVLEQYIHDGSVTVRCYENVTSINADNGLIIGVTTETGTYVAAAYILATGGNSHPETGSTGDGFTWLQQLGCTVQAPTPTLVPLAVKESWVKNLSGVTIPSMKITFFVDGKKKFSLKGRVLFTHFGISGPLIINAAHRVADLLHEGQVTAMMDVAFEMNEGELDKHITAIFDANKNRLWKNVVKMISPDGLASTIDRLVSIPAETNVHSITKEQRRKIVSVLKALPMTITGLMGVEKAIVVDGGLALEELDMKTMRSKKYANLYVTGDLLHINRPSGGYSLQLCWTTGFVAGEHV